MSKITRLEVTLETGNRDFAGTDGDVYLAIGGREFNLDSKRDDFERGHVNSFLLGEKYQPGNVRPGFEPVLNPTENDPREPELDLGDVDKFPVWIRLSPTGAYPGWFLVSALVEITTDGATKPVRSPFYLALFSEGLWLGKDSGLYCFLTPRTRR